MIARRSRTLLVIAGIAIAALSIGVFTGTRITSPADAAARTDPPEATDVTVPVELRGLNSEVVTRGDVTFAGSIDVTPEVGGLETAPVVTGQVPTMGSKVQEGTALLEIVGRPLVVLQGQLPMYRSLGPGMSGPDVEQLEQTLDRLGYDPGEVDDEYTASTGNAIDELYERVGYEPPPPDPQTESELDAAADAVDTAEAAVASAEDELMSEPDTSAESNALEQAEDQLEEARSDYAEAQEKAGTPLPAAEVVFVPGLPRRVDEVNVERGGQVEGVSMSVSGADLQVTANVDETDGELLKEKMKVRIEVPGGGEVPGTITAIEKAKGENKNGYTVRVAPGEVTAEQAEALREANVRVTAPVESTDGKVLAVPLAALTAGPGGGARVQVRRDETTDLVEVEVGLTAEGYAEVEPLEGELTEGDLVVVGEGGGDDTGG